MRRLQHHRAIGVSLGHGKMSQTRDRGHRTKIVEIYASGTWALKYAKEQLVTRMYKRVHDPNHGRVEFHVFVSVLNWNLEL